MAILFNINESKKMSFDLAVAGVDPQDLSARFIIEMDDKMGVCFPANIIDGVINVEFPALDSIIKIGMNEGDLYDARLEIITNETLLTPWRDQIKIKKPINVEARMVEMKDAINDLKLDIKVSEPKEEKKKEIIKEEKTEKKKSKFAEMFK
jgi:hypothetical protein